MNGDQLHKFIFQNLDIRGHLVLLDESLAEAMAFSEYPPAVHRLLAQSLCTSVLLSATLKIEGATSLQARSDGPVTMLMAEANHKQQIRGIARYTEAPASAAVADSFSDGATLAITLTPKKGERYQGIVALTADDLAGCIEEYFERSEQLPTKLWLFQHEPTAETGRPRVGGLLLQCLPTKDKARQGLEWERIGLLAGTLRSDEVFDLPVVDILYRLFNEDDIRLLTSDPVSFHCSCSEERLLNALRAMPAADLEEMRAEHDRVEVTCQFCGKRYSLDPSQLKP